ncbi:hypothetical protein [Limnobacter sp.]|uniref:hypothetical protein n=1 Tax=Limnobacter sp. TaxID=2003368 RepID=UPI003514C165
MSPISLIKFPATLLAVCALLLNACASTPGSSTAQQVAEGGQQYVAMLGKVNKAALEHSLGFTADLLPRLPRTQATLQEQTELMQQRVVWLGQVQQHFGVQASYFAALQALAKGDTSSNTQKAVKALAGALEHVPGLPSLGGTTKTALGGLAQHVAKAHHSDVVAQVLQRDADAVANALLYNQQVLEEQIQWITQREQLARQVDYRDKVQKPYVEGNKLPEAWKKAWKTHVLGPPTVELLQQARQASLRMQEAWLNVLRGQGSINQLGGVFAELEASVQATRQGIAQAEAMATVSE